MSNINENPSDEIKSNITQLVNSFHNFDSLLDNTNWVKTVKLEDIKTVFKLGNFIEKASQHFSSQNTLQEFLSLYKIQHANKDVGDRNYILACDEVLKVFFRYENVPELTLDIVIRIYTSMYPRDRLQLALYDLMLTSNNLEALSEFVNVLPKEKSREFEYYLNLCSWNHLKDNKKDLYIYNIREQLSSFNLESNLKRLLGMLSLKVISKKEEMVQNDILEIILEKMVERSILSSVFWYTLFHKIELDILCKVCENFGKFCHSLFSFIIYLGSMMDKDGDIWKSDPSKSVCPEISFYDLLVITKNIYKCNSKFVLNELKEAKSDTGSAIWDEIKNELILIIEEKM